MEDNKLDFDKQTLVVSNNNWTVEISYESSHCQNKTLNQLEYHKSIALNEGGQLSGILGLRSTSKKGEVYTCKLTEIDGGVYLHSAYNSDNSYSVKLIDRYLLLSLGFTIIKFDLEAQEIKWKLRPDNAEIFEFYDLENDYLLRGELEIHRIDTDGNIKWSYGGRDIWVNIDGEKEVRLNEDKIFLTDFEGNHYTIDFNGNTISDNPKSGQKQRTNKWWQVWK